MCGDVNHNSYVIPSVEIRPERVFLIMISEAAPNDPGDDFYAKGRPLYLLNTIQAFRDAGAPVTSLADILELGVYLTTAIKCSKTAYTIQADTVRNCSHLLEKELALFPRARAYLLMGSTAILALNYIAVRAGEPEPVPDGATYDVRKQVLWFRGRRVFPSYVHTRASYLTATEKRKMVAQDILNALRYAYTTRPLSR
jgi:uracil-DNA glycosylase